ncbi:MAG: MFS transporter, partial [Thermaerobacterales bacterium]
PPPPRLELLVASQVIVGISQLMVIVGAQAKVARIGTMADRERNFGYFAFFASVGQLAGPVAGGLLYDFASPAGSFLVGGLVTAAGLPPALRLLRDAGQVSAGRPADLPGRPGPHPAQDRSIAAPQSIFAILGLPTVVVAVVASSAMLFGGAVRQSFFPLYIESLGYGATVIGILAAILGLTSMVVRPFMSHLTARFGRFGLLSLSLLLAGLGLGVIPLVTGFSALAFLSLVTGIGFGYSQPLSMVLVADAVGDDRRGKALGVRLASNRLAQLIAPLLFGVLVAWYGLESSLIAAGLFPLAGLAVMLWFLRRQGVGLGPGQDDLMRRAKPKVPVQG